MLTFSRLGAAFLGTVVLAASAPAGLVAYNDFNVVSTPANASNVTTIGNNGPTSGTLIDQATGTAMGTLQLSGVTGYGTGSDGPAYPTGESKTYFDGIVNNAVGYAYTQSPTTPLVIAFSGLDPAATYDLVAFSLTNQTWELAHLTLVGATSFQNQTTLGLAFPAVKLDRDANQVGGVVSTTTMTDDTTVISQNGLTVAHYANVVPSATGSFSLNLMLTSGDTSGRINGIRLAVVPEPASLGLIGLGGLGLLARRRRRVPA